MTTTDTARAEQQARAQKEGNVSGSNGLKQSVSNLTQYLRTVPAVEIDSLQRDSNFLSQIGQCESALKTIRRMLSRG